VLYQGIGLFARFGRHRLLTGVYPIFAQLGFNELVRQFNKYQADELIASMDRNGIETTVICAIEPFFETLDLLETVKPYGHRLAVFCSVDPEEPDFAEKFAAYLETGMVYGLKIHPALAGPSPTSERMFELVGLAERHRLPVIIHTGTFPFPLCEGANDVFALEPVIRAFPEVPIVLAHIGWDQHDAVIALGRDYPNVYTDTSWQPAEIIKEALEGFGPDRVMFGSDFPLFQQAAALAPLIEAVPPAWLPRIGYENAARLLARSHPEHFAPAGGVP
jgi:predicted TIM-barrel fold metal-dependent hydrolase